MKVVVRQERASTRTELESDLAHVRPWRIVEALEAHGDELWPEVRAWLFPAKGESDLVLEVRADLGMDVCFERERKRIIHDENLVWHTKALALQAAIFPAPFGLSLRYVTVSVELLLAFGLREAADQAIREFCSRAGEFGSDNLGATSLRRPPGGFLRVERVFSEVVRAAMIGHELGHYVAVRENGVMAERSADLVGLELILLLRKYLAEDSLRSGIHCLPLIWGAITWLESLKSVVRKLIAGESVDARAIALANEARINSYKEALVESEAEEVFSTAAPSETPLGEPWGRVVSYLAGLCRANPDAWYEKWVAHEDYQYFEQHEEIEAVARRHGVEQGIGGVFVPDSSEHDGAGEWAAVRAMAVTEPLETRKYTGYVRPKSFGPLPGSPFDDSHKPRR